MKKVLLLVLTVFGLLSVNAQETGGSTTSDTGLQAYIDILKNIDGCVFLSLDARSQERSLQDILDRTNKVNFDGGNWADWTWESLNEGIASVYSDEGILHGNSLGETIVTASNSKGEKHHFIVFVCPLVSVVSPEGAVYTHHKVYNHKAKIHFTASDDYLVNCVMLDYEDPKTGERVVKDITSMVEKSDSDNDGATDGYYVSTIPIVNNMMFTVTTEHRSNNNQDDVNGEVVSSSKYNLQMHGNTLTIVDSKTLEPVTNIGKGVEIRDITGKVIYSTTLTYPESGSLTFNESNHGVFFVTLPKAHGGGTYKVAIP